MITPWSKFIQDNFDKIILLFVFLFCVGVVVHIAHDARDSDLVFWGREMTGTVLGALLGLITGHALAASRMTATTSSDPSKATVVAETK